VYSVKKIQRWWIARLRRMEEMRKAAIEIQRMYRAMVGIRNFKITRAKLIAQDRMLIREKYMRKVENQMLELDKIMSTRDDLWPGDADVFSWLAPGTDVDKERHPMNVQGWISEVFMKHRPAIRRTYMRFSILMVSDSKKAFEMSKHQFREFAKAIKYSPTIVDHIFDVANRYTPDMGKLHRGMYRSQKELEQILGERLAVIESMKTASTGGVFIGPNDLVGVEIMEKESPYVPQKHQSNVDKDDKTMVPNEFVYALTLLADKKYPQMQYPEERYEEFLERVIEPAATLDKLSLNLPLVIRTHMKNNAVQAVLEKYNNKLIRFFRYYTDSSKLKMSDPDSRLTKRRGSKDENHREYIDAFEWLLACDQCGVIGPGVSYAKVLDVFVRCNQQELHEYCYADSRKYGDPDYIKSMAMDFKEFRHAIVATAALKLDPIVDLEEEDPELAVKVEAAVVDVMERFLGGHGDHGGIFLDGPRQF